MNAKLVAGSVLSGLCLLAAVVNAWARHFFFAAFHVARGEALEWTGSFDPGRYADPETVRIFLGTRLLLWLLLAVGLALLAWGMYEEYERERASSGGL
ncbi:hypothetical protein [Candidatus Halobonum tyrrellensis]|uniref:Uncharacterized protein n=1 Tax=Candidatus Halobonum tyrrellensis G22 TaxID=1324957 RepID=V4HKB0_9EURY|nr:hypothetical protein [Candidatus Halobonum tyrrellensis]ESP88329.1 hypothetical protein K933_09407 [Candidatus Halobonum tyrrellensis G22]